jgi:hypothetical protein
MQRVGVLMGQGKGFDRFTVFVGSNLKHVHIVILEQIIKIIKKNEQVLVPIGIVRECHGLPWGFLG